MSEMAQPPSSFYLIMCMRPALLQVKDLKEEGTFCFTSQYQYLIPEILLQVRNPRRTDQTWQADNHGAENRDMQRHGGSVLLEP